MKKILGIIPARYSSTRFPAKALADVNGKPMVQCTYEQAKKCNALAEVVVATDHEEIFNVVESFGGKAVMTSNTHQSGTDRCFEALYKQTVPFDYVINIQGDEPFINPKQIEQVAELLDGDTQLATLAKEIDEAEAIFNPNVVKVIFTQNNDAMYFSRNPVPFVRNEDKDNWLNKANFHKHIGIYGYRADILDEITKLPQSELEKAESLEQLRWIENNYTIKVGITEYESIGIDTPEDLENALKKIN